MNDQQSGNMMGGLDLAYAARSYSIGIPGRSVCNARNHHWVAENSGGESIGAGELFCASISACAVNMVETIAKNEGKDLAGLEVNVSLYRNKDKPSGKVALYDAVRVNFELWGVSSEDAKYFVKAWKQR